MIIAVAGAVVLGTVAGINYTILAFIIFKFIKRAKGKKKTQITEEGNSEALIH